MQKNKNGHFFFYAVVIFSLAVNYECMAMQNTNSQQAPAKTYKVDEMDEAGAKTAVTELLADRDTTNKKFADLENTLAKEQEAAAKTLQELNFRKSNPDINVQTIGSLQMSPGVSQATVNKLIAEQQYLEAKLENKYGRTGRFVYAFDKAVVPVVQQELAAGANTLRQKYVFQTTIEKQNEKLGNLKIKGEKKASSINKLEIATKLLVLEHNRTNQEASENLSDAQTFGQMLQNQHALNELTDTDTDALTTKEFQDIQAEQVKRLHAKTFASKGTSSASVLCANRLVQEVVAKENKEKEKREQKKQDRLSKKLNS